MSTLLHPRQTYILEMLAQQGSAVIKDIQKEVSLKHGSVTKITINRDINILEKLNYIISKGKARSTSYHLSPQYKILLPLDVTKYFKTEHDLRIVKNSFSFDILSSLNNLFSKEEILLLNNIHKQYLRNTKNIPPTILKKEIERFVIELSWKSSKIEGNTYSLLETESLLKEHRESKNHSQEETQMILNHKKAFTYIWEKPTNFVTLSVRKIENIHHLLVDKLDIPKGLRKRSVGITGTKYRPLDNIHQIEEALQKTCQVINKSNNAWEKALITLAMLSYIQPFEDGNKRTSRLSTDAVLLAGGTCPLSYRSIDEEGYKKAVILFYEQNNISYLKQIFIEQYEFAVGEYFL